MHRNISIQLYSIHEELDKDFSGSLQKLAEIGYQWVESYGNFFGGLSSKDFSALLSSLNMNISGSHADIKLLKEKCREIIGYNKSIGCRQLICAFAEYKNEQDVFETASYFNEVGKICRDEGMFFSYHNHSHEFDKYSGKYILDMLLENTDPAFMGLELDVYWTARAGVDPAAYQKKWKERSILLHCKDMNDGPEKNFAAVGEGVLDFPAIIQAAPQVEYFVVEQDKSDAPFYSAEVSLNTLKKLLG
jgi:sugar phosphate isomerase/epimerase